MLLHDALINATAPQQTAMNLWMQRLYTSIHHLREPGVRRNFNNIQPIFYQQAGSAAGRKNFHTLRGQCFGKLNNA